MTHMVSPSDTPKRPLLDRLLRRTKAIPAPATEPEPTLLAEVTEKPEPKPESGFLGWSGTRKSGGKIDDDYNQDVARGLWHGDSQTMGIGRRMYREDDDVRAIIYSYVKAHLRNQWTITPADDSDEARMVAECASDLWFGPDWPKRLLNALMMCRDGVRLEEFAVRWDRDAFAPTWKMVDGQWEEGTTGKRGLFIPSFATRMPHSIDTWESGPDGSFAGVRQYYRLDDTAYSQAGSYDPQPMIPANKLLRYTFDEEGENWDGEPLIRSCYGGWKFRRGLRIQMGIGADRWATPVPVLEEVEPGIADKEAWDEAVLICEEYRSHQNQFIALPYGLKVTPLDVSMSNAQALQEQYDAAGRSMARATGTMFLYTGIDRGSQALVANQIDLWLTNAQHLADYVEGPNNALLKRWTRWNGWGAHLAPTLDAGELVAKDVKSMSETLKALKEAGFITPQIEDEEFLREEGGYPALTADAKDAMAAEMEEPEQDPIIVSPPTPGDTGGEEPPPAGKNAVVPPAKGAADDGEPAQLAVHSCDHGDMALAERRFVTAEEAVRYAANCGPAHALAESYFASQTSRIGREEKLAQTAAQVMPLIRKIAEDYAERIAGKSLLEARKVPVPGRAEIARKLKPSYSQVVHMGAGEVAREVAAQEADPNYADKFDAAMAELEQPEPSMWFANGVNPKTGKGKKKAPKLSTPAINEELEGMAQTSADALVDGIKTAGIQTTQNKQGNASASDIVAATAVQLTPRTVARQLQPDINGSYATGRRVAMEAADIPWGFYTTTPELSSKVCEECQATMDSTGNPFQMENGEPPDAFTVPNPNCLGILGGAGNPCWCAIIGLTQPPERFR